MIHGVNFIACIRQALRKIELSYLSISLGKNREIGMVGKQGFVSCSQKKSIFQYQKKGELALSI
jgi:hypothetical protein